MQKAALEAFRQQYPEREHFSDEIAADFYRTIAAKSIFTRKLSKIYKNRENKSNEKCECLTILLRNNIINE